MSRRDVPDSDPDDDGSASSSGEEEEEAEETTVAATAKTVSEYEKQRLSRIAENNAKLEALGLHKMAASLLKRKGKEKLKEEELDDHDDDDDEYIPDDDAEEPVSDSSDDKDEEFVIGNASGSRKRKVKDKGLKMKAKVSGKKHCNRNSEYVDGDDEDEALRQAIALSLQDSGVEDSSFKHVVKNITKSEKKRNIQNQEDKERKKNKKSFASRLQMTEDELIVHFFQLDEAGKGTVSMRDLQRAAIAHDFSWTDKELVDMIRCFDSDGDGRITLDDFRKIAVRCNLIRES
ncbi:hypothetical protein HN51_048533 [Arachis hypogaea]|uniref:EF-hand domain-containing protein n=1 Tax=Arachis hypogaea TaxID=3818 RepID=A0A445ALE4_ARAHY|nr:nucleolin isoform X1 [Arachis hypogaea]QHO25084.1 uncharacterized protein DS421_12g378040 [Arachis hypogaea]RYR27267.1 hypothetical protein Ahy_B02g061607 [Arachis hypogaea]